MLSLKLKSFSIFILTEMYCRWSSSHSLYAGFNDKVYHVVGFVAFIAIQTLDLLTSKFFDF
jgi:hypothetical protein